MKDLSFKHIDMDMSRIIKPLVTISLFIFVAAVTGLLAAYAMGGWGTKGSGNSREGSAGPETSRQPLSTGASPSGISMAELAKHNQGNDCWLLIKGEVYDVSSFINQHSGGKGSIINNCGQEVTGIFASIHTNRAWNLLTQYKVGSLMSVTDTETESAANTVLTNMDTARVALRQKYPEINIVDIKAGTQDEMGAKVVYDGALLELHLDGPGRVISQETVSDEQDWEPWSDDDDD